MVKLKWLALGALFIASSAFAAPDYSLASANDPANASAPASASQTAAASTFSLATGVDYSVGHYGATTDTTVWSTPIDAKAQFGRFRVEASLPYEFIKGPGQLVGGVIVAAPGGQTTARSGIGDLTINGAYAIARENGALPTIEIGGSVKAPTAKTSLGTRQADYLVSGNIYKTIVPNVMLFGSVGYSWLGSPAAYRLENGIMASGGINFRPTPSQNLGASVAYRDPVVAGLKGQAVVSPYWTYRTSKHLGFTLYGMAGLNNASPRVGGGLRLTVFP